MSGAFAASNGRLEPLLTRHSRGQRRARSRKMPAGAFMTGKRSCPPLSRAGHHRTSELKRCGASPYGNSIGWLDRTRTDFSCRATTNRAEHSSGGPRAKGQVLLKTAGAYCLSIGERSDRLPVIGPTFSCRFQCRFGGSARGETVCRQPVILEV